MKVKTRSISLRIPEMLYEQINRASREERRSLNNMLELLIEAGLRQMKQADTAVEVPHGS